MVPFDADDIYKPRESTPIESAQIMLYSCGCNVLLVVGAYLTSYNSAYVGVTWVAVPLM